jgi:hypothetical protein
MEDSPGELICAYHFKCNSINDVGELHYEKVGEDFEQVHESYRRYHPAFVKGW